MSRSCKRKYFSFFHRFYLWVTILQIHSHCAFQLLKHNSMLQAMVHFTAQVVFIQQYITFKKWGFLPCNARNGNFKADFQNASLPILIRLLLVGMFPCVTICSTGGHAEFFTIALHHCCLKVAMSRLAREQMGSTESNEQCARNHESRFWSVSYLVSS